MNKKGVLITGCAGFIGSNLAKCLLKDKSLNVYGVDDLSNGQMAFVPEGVNFTKSCFSQPIVLDLINSGIIQTVVHLAAVPRVSYSVKYPLLTNDTNVSKTLKLIDTCKGKDIRFVFASSSSVYGGADVLPTSNITPKNPKSPYALQKSMIEDYLKMYHDLYNLDSVCLRFFNVFGPNQLGGSAYATAVSSWLNAIMLNEQLRSDGDGTQSRDMCHIDNVVEACRLAILKSEPLSSVRLNVACGDRTTNNEILEFLLSKYPRAVRKDVTWRAGDVMHTQADISVTEEVLGYTPVTTFWKGLDGTIKWFEANWSDGLKIRDMKTKM